MLIHVINLDRTTERLAKFMAVNAGVPTSMETRSTSARLRLTA